MEDIVGSLTNQSMKIQTWNNCCLFLVVVACLTVLVCPIHLFLLILFHTYHEVLWRPYYFGGAKKTNHNLPAVLLCTLLGLWPTSYTVVPGLQGPPVSDSLLAVVRTACVQCVYTQVCGGRRLSMAFFPLALCSVYTEWHAAVACCLPPRRNGSAAKPLIKVFVTRVEHFRTSRVMNCSWSTFSTADDRQGKMPRLKITFCTVTCFPFVCACDIMKR